MLATLNLQLAPSVTPDDATATIATLPPADDPVAPRFTDLLRMRVDSSLADEQLSGDFLPIGGNNLPQSSPTVRLSAPVLPEMQMRSRSRGSFETFDASKTQALSQPLTQTQGVLPTQTPGQTHLTRPTHDAIVPEWAPPPTSPELAVVATLTSIATEANPPQTLTEALTRAQDVLPTTPEPNISDTSTIDKVALDDLNGRTFFAPSDGVILESIRRGIGAGIEIPPRAGVAGLTTPPQSPVIVLPPDSKGQWLGLPAQSGDVIETLPARSAVQHNRIQSPSEAVIAATSADEIQDGLKPVRRPETVALVRSVSPADGSRLRERPRISQVLANQPATQPPSAPTMPRLTGEPSSTAGAQPSNTPIGTPVPDPSWGERISERVLTIVGSQFKTAEIRLTPAELGPVRVQVSVDEGATNVTFHAQHSVTREAIELALPRLREMLAENGLSLGQASVGEHDETQGNRDQNAPKNSLRAPVDDIGGDRLDEEVPLRQKVVTANSLVDTFA